MLKRFLILVLTLVSVPAFAGSVLLLNVGGSGSVAPPSNIKTPLMGTFRLSTANPALFGAAGAGSFNGTEQTSVITTSTVRRVPVPFPATIGNLHTNLATTPTATDTATLSKTVTNTAVDGTVTCTYAVVSGTNNSCSDDVHFDTFAAGNLFQTHFTSSDSQIQALVGQISYVLTATGGQKVALMNQPSGSAFVAASSTPAFFAPGSGGTNLTEAIISFQFCPICAGTITGFFLVPNVTETGIHTWTVNKNGAATGMTFNTSSATTGGGAAGQCISPNGASDSIGGGTVINPCTSNAGLTFAVAAGDTISVVGSCPANTGCATAIPGFSLIFVPATQNIVPLSATLSTGLTTPYFLSADGYNNSASTIGQQVAQLAPAAMTFSSFQYCSLTQSSGGTKTGTFQTGATPGANPTTPGTTLSVTYAPGAGACPNNGGTFLAGAVDSTHTVSVTANQTVDTAITTTAATGTQTNKVSMAVNVP